MPSDKWFPSYEGETTDELLALENDFRIDSLVVAFEQAIQQKQSDLSKEENYVLAIEALEREANNGGYSQFFLNSSHEYVDVIEDALLAIGCPNTAAITRSAIAALGLHGELTAEKANHAVLVKDDAMREALSACNTRYFDSTESIEAALFAWIKANRAAIRIGGD